MCLGYPIDIQSNNFIKNKQCIWDLDRYHENCVKIEFTRTHSILYKNIWYFIKNNIFWLVYIILYHVLQT